MTTNIQDIIRRKALQYGVDPTTALAFAQIESGMNPAPKTGNGGGLFQLDSNWWSKYGNGADINDPAANADAFMRYYKGALLPGMTKQLGRQPTPGELYLGHQQGVAGAGALLSNPTGLAVDTISPFYNGLGTAMSAITGNGGGKMMLAGDFANMWNRRLDAAAKGFDPGWGGSGSAIISTPGQPAMMAAAPPPDAQGVTITKTGATPDPTKLAYAQPNDHVKDLMAQGMGLLSGPQPQAPPLGAPPPQVHGANPMMMMRINAGLLDPMSTPILNRNKQQLAGLLGIG